MTAGRSIMAPSLIDRAISLVKEFDPKKETGDSYAEEATQTEESHADQVFLKQVLYGCVRYKDALRVFLKHYYNDMASSVLRNDFTLYMVLGYLLLFRLDELGFGELRRLTSSEDPTKMAQLLNYLMDWERVEGQLTQDWLTVFDLKYINDKMVGGLRRASAKIKDYCEKLAVKAFSLSQAREEAKAKMGLADVAEKPLTVPRPFNLTKPGLRKVPEPIKIDQASLKTTGGAVLVGPSTDRLYRTNLAEVESGKKERLEKLRRQTVDKYKEMEEAGRGMFRLHETRNTLDALKEEAEKRMVEQLQFDKRFPTDVPKYPEEGSQVRLNAAAILREDALLKRKQGQDAKLIKSFESELRDSTEYYLWQTEMRDRDAAIRKEQVERKRAYAKASQQAARDSLEMQRAANSEIAARIKVEKDVMKEQREAEEELAVFMNRRLVKEVAEVRSTAPKDAVKRVLDEKKWGKEKLCQELEELRAARKREVKEEEAKKKEAVLKLKEQDVHEHHVKVFDPTESAGLGLLNEMSLVETKVRLEANERRRAEAESVKRREILLQRAEREADLRDRLHSIQERRAAAKQANRDAARERKEREAAQAEADRIQRERNNIALMEELEMKRLAREAEMAALAEEEERRKKATLYLGRAAAAVEENNQRQMVQGAEREAERRQRLAREGAEKYQKVTREDRRQVEENVRKREARKLRLYKKKQAEFDMARKRLVEEQRGEMRKRQESFKAARQKAKQVRDKIVEHNPYADAIGRESIAKAKRAVTLKEGRDRSKINNAMSSTNITATPTTIAETNN
ncbi:unnamed protein product, partial [Scytosiphon promiscuus]